MNRAGKHKVPEGLNWEDTGKKAEASAGGSEWELSSGIEPGIGGIRKQGINMHSRAGDIAEWSRPRAVEGPSARMKAWHLNL